MTLPQNGIKLRVSLVAACTFCLSATTTLASPLRVVDKDDYTDRLHAMWLGQCIANWTGLTTEGLRADQPFFTDEDWGTTPSGSFTPINFVLTQNPWQADDDTDIEYVYLHLLSQLGRTTLSANEIRNGWIAHINRYIWVSNDYARSLMGLGLTPPATGLPGANPYWLRIDAQLTTEFFGALAPGMPSKALAMGDLPIRATSAGYATHASQFFACLYAEAAAVDRTLPINQQIMNLVEGARRVIPDSSKTADIVDYVLADFATNANLNDWERTRDRVYERYQLLHNDAYHGFPSPTSRGFRYYGWTESSVNFACGLIALLYGHGDFARTVQIGTLSGWDSDNGTATMGALLGLLRGTSAIAESFPDVTFADRYNAYRTRDNLPDYLPSDPAANDTLTLMAQRMLPIVQLAITESGGVVDLKRGRWLLPPPSHTNPLTALDLRSANVQVRRAGGSVSTASSVNSNPVSGYGVGQVWHYFIGTGIQSDGSGFEPDPYLFQYYSTQNAGATVGSIQTLTVTYSLQRQAQVVRFIEGMRFPEPTHPLEGGWFTSASIEIRGVDGIWRTPERAGAGTITMPTPLDPAIPFQIIDFVFQNPVVVTGVRISGPVGGSAAFVTCLALDALAPETTSPVPFDLDSNQTVNVDDLYKIHAEPTDLDDDGVINQDDTDYMEARLRWLEWQDMSTH